MYKISRLIVLTLLTCLSFHASYAQHTALKTNALYWVTTTFNVGAETRLSPKWTLDVSVGYNPFTFDSNKKLKHFVVQPEARYWLCNTFAGHFIGGNLMYSHYNVGGINMPFGIFPELEDHRFQGDIGAIGFVYGYSWMLPNRRWSLEAVVGLGYGITRYSKYSCEVCGSKIENKTRGVFMPTKLSFSVVYYLK